MLVDDLCEYGEHGKHLIEKSGEGLYTCVNGICDYAIEVFN